MGLRTTDHKGKTTDHGLRTTDCSDRRSERQQRRALVWGLARWSLAGKRVCRSKSTLFLPNRLERGDGTRGVEAPSDMIAIEETTAVQADGSLVLRNPELKAGERVKVIVLLQGQPVNDRPPATGRRLRQSWAGGLADLAAQYSSVELQHKAREWRGD